MAGVGLEDEHDLYNQLSPASQEKINLDWIDELGSVYCGINHTVHDDVQIEFLQINSTEFRLFIICTLFIDKYQNVIKNDKNDKK
jgi:hypothetical protein